MDTPTKHQKLDEIDAYKNPVVAESQCKIGILRLVTPMHHWMLTRSIQLKDTVEYRIWSYYKSDYMVILPLDYEIEKQMQIQDTKMDNQEVYPNDFPIKHILSAKALANCYMKVEPRVQKKFKH